jgi:hypothetical protein
MQGTETENTMKAQRKQLTLKKETLRDLTAVQAGEVKGGKKGLNTKKRCVTLACGTYDCVSEYCW